MLDLRLTGGDAGDKLQKKVNIHSGKVDISSECPFVEDMPGLRCSG